MHEHKKAAIATIVIISLCLIGVLTFAYLNYYIAFFTTLGILLGYAIAQFFPSIVLTQYDIELEDNDHLVDK